jgi:hypothetical protein
VPFFIADRDRLLFAGFSGKHNHQAEHDIGEHDKDDPGIGKTHEHRRHDNTSTKLFNDPTARPGKSCDMQPHIKIYNHVCQMGILLSFLRFSLRIDPGNDGMEN